MLVHTVKTSDLNVYLRQPGRNVDYNKWKSEKRLGFGPEIWVHYSLKILETTLVNILHTEKEWEIICRIVLQSSRCNPKIFPGQVFHKYSNDLNNVVINYPNNLNYPFKIMGIHLINIYKNLLVL